MFTDAEIKNKTAELSRLAKKYETAVQVLSRDHYLEEFFDFYEIRNRNHKLIPAAGSFHEELSEVSGSDVWQPIAEKTESFFGLPEKIFLFEDVSPLIKELDGPDGLAPFFFVFDVMFCVYKDFTLCFMSGTNN